MYEHVIRFSEEERRLYIYRVFANGREELLTYVSLDGISLDSGDRSIQKLAQWFGENILLDSPIARKLLNICI